MTHFFPHLRRTQANCEAIRQFVSSTDNSPVEESVRHSDGNSTDDSGIESSWSKEVDLTSTISCTRKASTRRANNMVELGRLLADTDQLLARNTHLRASFSISTTKPKGKLVTAAITIPTPKLVKKGGPGAAGGSNPKLTPKLPRRVHFSEFNGSNDNAKHSSSSSASSTLERKNARKVSQLAVVSCQQPETEVAHANDLHSDYGSDPAKTGTDSSSDNELSSASSSPFKRYIPSRKAPTAPNPGGGQPAVRRSIRLPPKTVAKLASKFDNPKADDKKMSKPVSVKHSIKRSNSKKQAPKEMKVSERLSDILFYLDLIYLYRWPGETFPRSSLL